MTVNSINGISLDDNLSLTGPNREPLVAMSARKTLGRVVIQRLAGSGGRRLVLGTLRTNGVAGTFTGAQDKQLAALRDAGQPVTLVHHRGTFRVVVLAVELEPINGVADPGDNTLMVGDVTMIEV